ncbi:MAG: radical SAM protein [Promethearchaeota archaeon]
MKSYNVYIDTATWDCQVNLIDSSRIYRYMIGNDHKITNDPFKADFIIINSCGFIKKYQDISLNLFDKYYSLKKEKATIILYGCLIRINPKLIESLDAHYIDLFEPEKFDKIFYKKIKFEDIRPYCDQKTREKLSFKKANIEDKRYPIFFLTELLLPFSKKLRITYNKICESISNKNRAFIEISKGCMGNCSYCIIKKARGKINSREIKDIILDIEQLKNSTKKIYLVANDCGCYGQDINTNLIELLYEINKKYPNLSIDLDYLNPFLMNLYSDKYIKLFKDVKIDFVTIPIQGSTNKILKRMNRNYNINKTIKVVDKIKKVSPKTFIYSHFIIGYPGENTIDFLKSLACSIHFDLSIPFQYCEHEGTASASLPNHKSKFAIITRHTISTLFLNFIILYKLLRFAKN